MLQKVPENTWIAKKIKESLNKSTQNSNYHTLDTLREDLGHAGKSGRKEEDNQQQGGRTQIQGNGMA